MALVKTGLSRRSAIGSLDQRILMGMNAHNYAYGTSTNPFINIIHGSSYGWDTGDPAYVDALGWISNMPSGATNYKKYVILHTPYGVGYVRPGRYAITWTGPLTVSVASGIPSNIVATDHRVEFDLPLLDASNSRGAFIQLVVTNTSGAAGSVTDIAVFHKEDESRFNAGKVFQDDFLHSFDGAEVVRVMDFMDINSSTVENFSDFATEAHCDWHTTPISVIGKLMQELPGKNLWFSMPHKATQACMNSVAQTLFSYLGSTQRVYCEFSNETWNGLFGQKNYLRDTKAPSLPGYPNCIVDSAGVVSATEWDKVGCATAHGCMQMWAAFEAYFPRARIVRVFAGQLANWPANGGGFEYADASATLYGGAKLKTLMDGYAVAAYYGWTGGYSGIPSDMSQKAQIQRRDDLQTDDFWNKAVFNDINVTLNGWLNTTRNSTLAKRGDINLLTYELGGGFQTVLGTDGWSGVTVVGGQLEFGVDISSYFSSGEKISYAYAGQNGKLFLNSFHWTGYLVKTVPGQPTRLRVFANQTDYNNDTDAVLYSYTVTGASWSAGTATLQMASTTGLNVGQTINVSGITPSGYNAASVAITALTGTSISYAVAADPGAWSSGGTICGSWTVDNAYRVDLLGAKYKSLNDSYLGVLWYQELLRKIRQYGFVTFVQFTSTGGYLRGDEGYINYMQWGLKRSHWESDANYPRAAWFRHFAKGA